MRRVLEDDPDACEIGDQCDGKMARGGDLDRERGTDTVLAGHQPVVERVETGAMPFGRAERRKQRLPHILTTLPRSSIEADQRHARHPAAPRAA